MTEKEKMLAGEIYDANYDEQLIAERLAAQDLCHDYNLLKPSDLEGRQALIDRLGIKHGANCVFQQPFICDYGYNISVGEGCVIGARSIVNKDIPAHHLAVGNPCRPIRKI